MSRGFFFSVLGLQYLSQAPVCVRKVVGRALRVLLPRITHFEAVTVSVYSVLLQARHLPFFFRSVVHCQRRIYKGLAEKSVRCAEECMRDTYCDIGVVKASGGSVVLLPSR